MHTTPRLSRAIRLSILLRGTVFVRNVVFEWRLCVIHVIAAAFMFVCLFVWFLNVLGYIADGPQDNLKILRAATHER